MNLPCILRWAAAVFLTLALPVFAADRTEIEVDAARHQDPVIERLSVVTVFSPRLKPLWLEALARPEVDLKRQAAQTIALACQRGMPGLADTAAPLMKTLAVPDQHPVVVLAVARALIVLDARQAAPLLFHRAMADGLEVSQLVEPALARWDYRPIRKVWLDRLSATGTRRRLLVLAIRGLGAVGEPKAKSRLRELALAGDVAPDVRLEAARALGTLQTDGLEEDARNLVTSGDRRVARSSAQELARHAPLPTPNSPLPTPHSPLPTPHSPLTTHHSPLPSSPTIVDRLVAASLLSGHRGEAAEALLRELAADSEPSVAAIALERLLEIDPMLVIPIVGRTIANDDANVRLLGARALVAWRTPEAIERLGPMLDDPHPELRTYVRRSLLEMASEAELAEQVLEEALAMLATGRWRGLEQASLMVVALDHKPAAERFVQLLEFGRAEVFVTAAWGLRRLAVPATLDRMYDKARRLTEAIEAEGLSDINVVWQSCQLIEAFGQMKYMRADPLLRKYIPKQAPYGVESRAAAIWTLGHLHAGKPEPELVRQFAGRLSDINPVFPEEEPVRQMSAVSLGRMKAESSLGTLRRFLKEDSPNGPVGYACGWAIHQITGEPIPKPRDVEHSRLGWFLEPLER